MTADAAFAALIGDVAAHLFGEPNGKLSRGHERRYGANGSLAVDVQAGTWFSHEANTGGGVLDLVVFAKAASGKAEAADYLRAQGFAVPESGDGRRKGGQSPGSPPPVGTSQDPPQRIAATYDYHTADGALAYQVVRYGPRKTFRQRRPDSGRKDGWAWNMQGVGMLPYRLPELIEDIAAGRTICLAEGEKDVDALRALGIPATCNAGGAGKFQPELAGWFEGADVLILPDNDKAGEAHREQAGALLAAVCGAVRVLRLPDLPEKGDAADWVAAGGTADALWRMAETAAPWPDALPEPPPAPPEGWMLFGDIDLPNGGEWLIRRFLPEGGLGVMYGYPGGGKTFLALDMALHIAATKAWHGHAVQGGGVLYLAAEGQAGLRKRVLAWRQHYEAAGNTPFALWPGSIDFLGDSGDVERVIDAADAFSRIWGQGVRLIVIDTLARSIQGGDENRPEDMGKFLRAAEYLQRGSGAAVLVVHHPAKGEGARGPRGHSSLLGAVDTSIQVESTEEGAKCALIDKQKDGEDGIRFFFGLKGKLVGYDDQREPVTSCVVELRGEPGPAIDRPRLSDVGELAWQALLDLVGRSGRQPPESPHIPQDVTGGSVEGWRQYCIKRGVIDADAAGESAWRKARSQLLRYGYVGQWEGFAWPIIPKT